MNRFPIEEDQGDEMATDSEISMKEEDSDVSYHDEMLGMERESQIQKLNHRITLLSVLIPCLLGAILLFGYLEFNDKLNKSMTMGSGQVEALSESLEDKIASLSQQYGELEKLLSESIAGLKKTNALIEKDLKENQRETKKLTTSKVDKKALEQAIKNESTQTAKTLEALRNELNGQKQAVEKLNETLNKEVVQNAQFIEVFETDLQRQSSAIKKLSENKLDKKDFSNMLQDKWTDYETKISLLQKEIKALKFELSKLQQGRNMDTTSNTVSQVKGASLKAKPAATEREAVTPTPGEIIEQEITE